MGRNNKCPHTIEDYTGAVLPMGWAFVFYGFLQEITSNDLRKSEERLNLAIEGANDGIWDFYPQTGQVHYSPRWFTMLGYEPDEFSDTYETWKTLLNPYDMPKAEEIVKRFLENGEERYSSEFRMQAKDGQWRWINARGKVVERDEEGNVKRMIGTHSDITERKRTEESLRKSEERYRLLVERMNDGLIVTDANGAFTYINRKMSEIIGLSSDRAIGLQVSEFVDESNQKILKAQLAKRRKGVKKAYELVFTRKDGVKIPAIVSPEPLIDDGGRYKGAFAVITEITELKQAEKELKDYQEHLEDLVKQRTSELQAVNQELEEKNQQLEEAIGRAQNLTAEAEAANLSKSEFVARMSHEIRTPMNAILGMTELLTETEISPEQRDYLKTLSSSGEFLLSTINDILDFSKIEANQIELEEIAFDVCDLVEDISRILAVRAHEKQLEMACRIAPEIDHYRLGDPTRLRQVLFNLLGNAIKFTDQGDVELNVELEVLPGQNQQDPELLEFRVRDTGVGIAPENMELVFESFTQADTSTTRQFGGTGLGLAICKQLVELMGGRIWIESELGRGTTFFFTARLPCTDQVPQTSSTCEADLKKLKVLVVDDNATNRRVASEYLLGWGAEVSTAKSGGQALEELARAQKGDKPYELVLLDINMPGMDGFEVAEHIKSLFTEPKPAVVILTSSDSSGDKARSSDLGLEGYLGKPIIRADLLQGILAALGKDEVDNKGVDRAGRTKKMSLPPLRLLLAEDIDANRKVISRFLKQTPVAVEMAEDGQQALEKYIGGRFDVVLMDIQMPVMDGFEATRAIRAWEKENKAPHIPIVALTAHAFEEQRQQCFEAGCSTFLSKPVKKKDLLNTLANLFAEADSGRENISFTGGVAVLTENIPAGDVSSQGTNRVQVDADLEDLVPDFFAEIEEDLGIMEKSLQKADFETPHRLGHGLKGAAGNYELHDLTKIFLAIEQAAKMQNGNAILENMDRVKGYLRRLEIEYV